MTELTSRERIRKILAFEEPDRIGLHDAFWEDTLIRWRAEGMPAGVKPTDYFGFDFDHIYMDASLRMPEKLLEDTDKYTVRQDKHGFIAKQWKGKSGALGYLDHEVTNRHDWERLRGRLIVDFGETSRFNVVSYFEPFVTYPSWEEMADTFQKIRERRKYILLAVYGPHEANWRKHGFEETLMDMALDPGFIADMSQAHVELIIQTLEKAQTHCIKPDGVFIAEDLGISTGPMFSPKTYDKVLFPEHRRLGDYLHANDIAYFMHTDGNITKFIPRLIEAGVQVLQPIEAKVGLDIRELKKEYGNQLTLMGNIDVQKLSASKAELEEEVRTKLAVAMPGGGYIYHSDHSVPSTVSYENYLALLELLHKHGRYNH